MAGRLRDLLVKNTVTANFRAGRQQGVAEGQAAKLNELRDLRISEITLGMSREADKAQKLNNPDNLQAIRRLLDPSQDVKESDSLAILDIGLDTYGSVLTGRRSMQEVQNLQDKNTRAARTFEILEADRLTAATEKKEQDRRDRVDRVISLVDQLGDIEGLKGTILGTELVGEIMQELSIDDPAVATKMLGELQNVLKESKQGSQFRIVDKDVDIDRLIPRVDAKMQNLLPSGALQFKEDEHGNKTATNPELHNRFKVARSLVHTLMRTDPFTLEPLTNGYREPSQLEMANAMRAAGITLNQLPPEDQDSPFANFLKSLPESGPIATLQALPAAARTAAGAISRGAQAVAGAAGEVLGAPPVTPLPGQGAGFGRAVPGATGTIQPAEGGGGEDVGSGSVASETLAAPPISVNAFGAFSEEDVNTLAVNVVGQMRQQFGEDFDGKAVAEAMFVEMRRAKGKKLGKSSIDAINEAVQSLLQPEAVPGREFLPEGAPSIKANKSGTFTQRKVDVLATEVLKQMSLVFGGDIDKDSLTEAILTEMEKAKGRKPTHLDIDFARKAAAKALPKPPTPGIHFRGEIPAPSGAP